LLAGPTVFGSLGKSPGEGRFLITHPQVLLPCTSDKNHPNPSPPTSFRPRKRNTGPPPVPQRWRGRSRLDCAPPSASTLSWPATGSASPPRSAAPHLPGMFSAVSLSFSLSLARSLPLSPSPSLSHSLALALLLSLSRSLFLSLSVSLSRSRARSLAPSRSCARSPPSPSLSPSPSLPPSLSLVCSLSLALPLSLARSHACSPPPPPPPSRPLSPSLWRLGQVAGGWRAGMLTPGTSTSERVREGRRTPWP